MKKTVTLSSKGQIVIPARIRRDGGLRAGDALEVRWEADRVVLEKSRRARDLSSLAKRVRLRYAGRNLEAEILEERDRDHRGPKARRP